MGNDRDTGKTVGYAIDVSIDAVSDASQPDGDLLPEEDFFIVTVASGSALNVRDAPRASGALLGQFASVH